MPRKVSRNMLCAFCSADRPGVYIELEVTVPDVKGGPRQLFGAHAECLTSAMSEGFEVDVEALLDDPAIESESNRRWG